MLKSLKLIITFRKCIIDASFVKDYAEIFFEEFFEGESYEYTIHISEPYNAGFDDICVRDLYEIEVSSEFTPALTDDYLVPKIVDDWCNPEKNKLSHLWLRLSNPAILENSGKLFHTDVQVKEIAFGSFPDMQYFMQHTNYRSNSDEKVIMCTFLHSQQQFFVYTCFRHLENCPQNEEIHNKFEFSYQSLSYVVVNYMSGSDKVEIFFRLEHFPFLYLGKYKNEGNVEALASYQDYQEDFYWNRTLDFGCMCKELHFTVETIGRCSVFKMVISKSRKTYDIIKRLIQRCPSRTLFYFTNFKSLGPKQDVEHIYDEFEHLEQWLFHPELDSDFKFKCQFAWNTVIYRSLEIRDQIILKYECEPSIDHWKNLKTQLKSYLREDVDALVESLYHISKILSKSFIFTFEDALRTLFEHYRDGKNREEVPKGMCLVRRIAIFPSKIIYIPPSEHFDNRVIRKFGTENLLRVSIQDDNFNKLTFAVQYNSRGADIMFRIVKCRLMEGIQIGPRKYEILASSNSQLREHGLWMYSKDRAGNTGQSIREWMGDFSQIKNVAKYMARMGQCFSSSDETVQIELDDDDILRIDDIKTEDEKYTFSDGIGMISEDLARKVRDQFAEKNDLKLFSKDDIYDPSAFQIRFKGCKGMVAESRTLEGCKIAIRPSMEKFSCSSSRSLEVVKISAPRQVFLNRPLITILENLGVKMQDFLDLQKKMVFNLTDSLIYERKARKLLENSTSLDFPFQKLSDVGISMTQEPFFRSLLLSIYKLSIERLKTKTRIEIPHGYGRNMLGVIDETRTLKKDEIFVQYSEEVGLIKSPTKILTGRVVVTTNPCMHPGDVRKLTAVDVPALHHIKDCIVFSAKGDRPVPDQMAGSDLDGDEYVVIWYPSLIFPKENFPPMSYPPNKEPEMARDIELKDMINFFCKYIQVDNIGLMASAFLAWADYDDDGIYSKVCMSIAQKYPQVLDFAKSGTTCSLTPKERPKFYPDFMEKGFRNNSYKSTKSLGVLYRIVRNFEGSVSTIDSGLSIQLDEKLEFSGWKTFEHLARKRKQKYFERIKNMLKKYGLQSEAEVLTGYVSKVNDYDKNKYDIENIVTLSKKYLVDTMKHYRKKFQKDYEKNCDEMCGVSTRRKVKYMMASAWYMVTYEDKESSILSFPWAVSDVLYDIRKQNCGRGTKISKSASIDNFDECLHSLYLSTGHEEEFPDSCKCFPVMRWAVMEWMKMSSFMLMLTDDVFCMHCFERIVDNFKCQMKCCSSSVNGCRCDVSCSPMKLILEFLKYYAYEDIDNLNKCEMKKPNSDIHCGGFKPVNLKSVALKTYTALAITQNLQYLGINGQSNTNVHSDSNEEGDPVRIRITEEFEELLRGNVDKICEILKKLTGVKKIRIDGNTDREYSFIIVHSIGNTLQRWNLEELIMDENCPDLIRSKMASG